MNTELHTFLDTYYRTIKQQARLTLLVSLGVYIVVVGVTLFIFKDVVSTDSIYNWLVLAFIGFSVGMAIFQLLRTRSILRQLRRFRHSLQYPGTTIQRLDLYKKDNKNSYLGITYSMKIFLNNSETPFELKYFHQNEAFFNEGIQVFTKAYSKAKVNHFEQ